MVKRFAFTLLMNAFALTMLGFSLTATDPVACVTYWFAYVLFTIFALNALNTARKERK